MRWHLLVALISLTAFFAAARADAQPDRGASTAGSVSKGPMLRNDDNLSGGLPTLPSTNGNIASLDQPIAVGAPGAQALTPAQVELSRLQQNVNMLRANQAAVQEKNGQKQDEKLQKQVDLMQKQIELQQKMIELLMDNMKKQAGGPAVESLQTGVATLDARSKQAALRDQELAQAIDNIVEHQDAIERNGYLPQGVKELFLPSGNNETILSIYGALAFGYSRIIGDGITAANGAGRPATPGGFYFGEFTPDFLLKVNDWIFLEAEIGIGADGSVSAGSFAQADFFINDWLTIIAGRFVAPIGWFNERLNNPWINKLPGDAPGSGPLLWQQVLPPLALLGVEATGSFYLGNSPVKLEYAAYISNGMNITPATAGAPTVDEIANLENMGNTFSFVSNDHAFGGRIGLWWPEVGLAGGISGFYNGDYVAGGFEDSMSLWAVDLNYHKGNWDVRAEYGMNYQQATDFLPNNIRRQGFYTQVAYRARDLPNGFWQQLEGVYRYSYVDIRGIDPTTLDLGAYSTPIDVPVRRQQNEFGINYYFTPRMVIKFAYQINDEPGFHLHDNQFLTEMAWGW
jgi:hypothetical protein